MADVKLKPCPFCGGEAHLVNLPKKLYGMASGVICSSCMAHTKIFITVVKQDPRTLEIVAIKDGGRDAIEAWNRRTHDNS